MIPICKKANIAQDDARRIYMQVNEKIKKYTSCKRTEKQSFNCNYIRFGGRKMMQQREETVLKILLKQ